MQRKNEPERSDEYSARSRRGTGEDDHAADEQSIYRPKRREKDLTPGGRSVESASAWTWQVIDGESAEIEGEATWIDEPDRFDSPAQEETRTERRISTQERVIAEHYDDVVVASVQTRRVEVTAGEAAKLVVSLLNNGEYAAIFEVNIEGWVDERWLEDLPLRLTLEPGERVQTAVLLAPPRLPSSRAGVHRLALVVRAPQYPERYTRAAAALVIRPYTEFTLGFPQPAHLVTSWLGRTCTFSVPVTNIGNSTIRLRLFGTNPHRMCSFSFFAEDWDTNDPGQTVIEVEPGQTAYVAVQVAPLSRPIIGFGPSLIPFRLVAVDMEGAGKRQFVEADLQNRPLIGPWHLAGIAGTLLIAVVGVLLIVFAFLVTLRASNQERTVVPLVQQEQVQPPVVALVLQVDKPLPTRPADVVALEGAPINPSADAVRGAEVSPTDIRENPTINNGVGTIPIVSADQVTAPGEPTPILVRPLVAPAPQADAPARSLSSSGAPMTYGDMFRDVGLQFDINWKVLAAQAYIESGFDSVALGQHGDLGLMQIQPATWREWSAQLNVSDPFDSHSNVTVAAAYLDYLRSLLTQEGYGELEWTLVAYNWGPDQVLDYLHAGGSWDDLDDTLKNYALDVLRISKSIPSP